MVAMVPIFLKSAVEHLSFVWFELSLASIAAIVYLIHAGRARKSKGSKMKIYSGSTKTVEVSSSGGGDQAQTPVQLSLKALRQGKFVEAIDILNEMPEVIAGDVPEGLAQRLLSGISRMPMSPEVMTKLKTLTQKVSPVALEAALVDALRNAELHACHQLHTLSNVLAIPKSQDAFQSLAFAYSCNAPALRALVEEADAPLQMLFATAVMESSIAQTDAAFVEEVFKKVSEADVEPLKEFLEKAVASPKPISRPSTPPTMTGSSESDDSANDSPRTSTAGEIISLRDSVSGACSTSKALSSKEVAMRANDIRSCGKNGDLRGAIKVFQRLGHQGESAVLVNSMLEACVECKDLKVAQEFFNQANKLGVADACIYNTMMKGLLAQGQEKEAKGLLAELSHKGMAATRSSFHGLLNARVNAKDMRGAWKLVEEMQAAGISPNAVSCSILMKGRVNSVADVSRVLALIESMDQPMDEVLFLSVVEACIRTGRLDLLTRQFDKFTTQCPTVCLSAPTFGTMIKAYGYARDTKRVWELWKQMLTHGAVPTAVTLWCMVEALVANGCALDAWQLTQKTWADEKTRHLVNTVIYSSILKGFAHNKETDKVMALYQEMRSHEIQPNTITYNTILNAFAQGGAMNRVPALLEDMKSAEPPVEPDIVTYSTIVKGFCNSGSLDRALKVLKDMKASGKFAADEVMYNSLLSGCAKEHRPDEALQLLSEMKKSGVAPSNYTLSMLVKLMGRCKRLNQAFVMLEDISKEYGLKINVQVYTCLIQGCFNASQAGKAIALHDKIIKEGLHPDAMTYSVLVRGCIQAGLLDKAAELARCAHGVSTSLPQSRSSPPGLAPGCLDDLVAALGGQKSDLAKAITAELGGFNAAAASRGDSSRHPPRRAGNASAQTPGFQSANRGVRARTTAKVNTAESKVATRSPESPAAGSGAGNEVAARAPWRVVKATDESKA
jgi:pentatricopeptide repeat protein